MVRGHFQSYIRVIRKIYGKDDQSLLDAKFMVKMTKVCWTEVTDDKIRRTPYLGPRMTCCRRTVHRTRLS